ncbi:integrase catalytic domain-containing protein [Trichonephila clavipes]|nr:integrase catalytic domain-containing protein [Trichonephila clavipes]
MIWINPDQRKLQRILWRENMDEPIKTFELSTVTYGTTSAPFLATRTLKQLALDEAGNFPLGSSVVMSDMYIDDVLTGAETLLEAKELKNQLMNIFAKGGMVLHKWCGYNTELIEVSENYDFSDSSEIKVLGVYWSPKHDCFSFRVKIDLHELNTKRDVLSTIARIYDPLGLLGPVVAKAKIFLQKLWMLKIDWTDLLPDTINREWRQFVESLQVVNDININRCIVVEQPEVIELHGFSDASQSAYGAVVYCKSITSDGKMLVHLIASKSRVAPTKPTTIPRLELCAAVLLAKLVHRVKQALKLNVTNTFLWSDSMIVLSWIRKESYQLKTFVANRIATIQEMTSSEQWRYVATEDNPADFVSRGMDSLKLKTYELWWNGPKFLMSNQYPQRQIPVAVIKDPAVHLDIVTDLTSNAFIATLKRFIFRRGKCAKLYSDNATNFVGANIELKKMFNLVCKPDEALESYMASEGIDWKFLPPRAPNFGGLWEAGVKSFKFYLKRVVSNIRLTYEEFLTVIIQIEGMLNSRPLVPLSSDLDDLNVLTPSHFLIGRSITSIVEPDLTNLNENRLDTWQKITKIIQLIWKRWSVDYLNSLQQRNKWHFEKKNAKIGDMVIIKEDNLPSCQWSLGRINNIYPGKGSKVRVGEVKTTRDGDRFNSCQVIYSQFGLAIHQNDHQARRRFVEWAQNEIAVVPDFHKRILFSDEAHFWLNGYVNKQNCRIWSEANPEVYVETPLYPEKLTVWCALWAGGIIDPYFFKNDEGHNVTVNGDRYRVMITNFFIPELNNHDVQELWFQQDSATCHTARATIDSLKDTFGDRLISRFGSGNWPPRSCDLTPLDYFLWSYVKPLVYADKPQTLDHLEDNIRRVFADIRPQMLEKVIENWTSRLDYIRASRGSHMSEIIFKM